MRSMKRGVVWKLGMAGAVAALLLGAVYALRWHLPVRWNIAVRSWAAGIEVNHDVRIRMPDGVQLAASLYLPRGEHRNLATVLMRLPYGRRDYGELSQLLLFAKHGYAVLVEDVRGKFDSEGEFGTPWEHGTEDGVATLDWIVRQPWSNGKVGTFGCSALGELQYVLARARHPAHAAMIPAGGGGAIGSARGSYEYFGLFEGGVFQLASGFGWFLRNGARDRSLPLAERVDISAALRSLPSRDMVERVQPGRNAFEDFLTTPLSDPAWARFDYVSDSDRIDVPALVINTWGDQTLEGSFALAEQARRDATPTAPLRQHVVIAPGNHCRHLEARDEKRFGVLDAPGAHQPYEHWYLQWFDHWLRERGDALASLPGYLFYVIGEGRWLTSESWPPERARLQRWYLGSAGHAQSAAGDGALTRLPPAGNARDSYRYDPGDPVPSRGGPVCCTGNPSDPQGPAEQRDVEARRDVLVYTSAPLERPLRIAGPLRARLTVSSSAVDTDFVARLVHVWPDGRSTSVQEGALRARYRDGPGRPSLMTPGQTYTVEIAMRSIAYYLPAGHRLRLHVTSSSFPRLERNLNTGGRNFDEAVGIVAVNSVHHGGGTPSYLELSELDVAEAR